MLKTETTVFPPQFSSVVLRELDIDFSRSVAKVAASDGPLPFGLVLTKNEDGEYCPFTEAAPAPASENDEASGSLGGEATGSEASGSESGEATGAAASEACAVLISPLAASETSRKAVVLTGYAILNSGRLVWDATVTNKEAALDQLANRGFVIREVADGLA